MDGVQRVVFALEHGSRILAGAGFDKVCFCFWGGVIVIGDDELVSGRESGAAVGGETGGLEGGGIGVEA